MKRPDKTNENRSTPCNDKTVKVELEVPGVKINLTKEIIIVDNIREINMITWFRDLEQIAEQNKWSEEQLLEILPYLVTDKKAENVHTYNTYEEVKKQTLLIAYPKDASLTILKILEKTRQIDFTTIEEYHEAIKINLEIYLLNTKCPKAEIDRRTEEFFLNGLGRYTADYLIRNKYKNFKEKLEDLNRIETEIKTKVEQKEREWAYNNTRRVQDRYRERLDEGYSKWCKYHKSKTHNTEECFKLARRDEERRSRNYTKTTTSQNDNYVMCEPRDDTKSIEIRVHFDKWSEKAILDTGSNRNYISETVVKEWKLKVQEDQKITTIYGNSTESVSKYSTTQICKIEGSKRTYNIKFYVLESLPVPMILGNEFLINNDVVLNLKNRLIMIGDEVIRFEQDENDARDLDSVFYDRVCLGLTK
ncbi:hypothetical protein NGRA_1418 [Nosema granulosis]|uniref:Pol polyprotein n=1 Tax=Nosema granulosis TaxID=83296 RepID=A0A9P6KZD7_9MICR|nr:hypothetical protein NGRA_1418 [Nosema granulosis]